MLHLIFTYFYLFSTIFTCLQAKKTIATTHPRLYFTNNDLPHLIAKKQIPFYANVLQQYQDALNHKLNYSAGGVMTDIEHGPEWTHQLATTLYLTEYGNNSVTWGNIAAQLVYQHITALTPATGNWFAGSERNLEQLIGSYDILYPLFNTSQINAIESSLALNANYMFSDPPNGLGVAKDMASRLMNPAADRLGAVGLIALTIPHHPNASMWLKQSIQEFKWMLANGVMEDGQWHEPSTRYHGRVLAAFIPFAYALRQANIMDPFNEIKNFKNFVGWYRHVQTPPDSTMNNCALTPALSDGNWETVWEVTLGWAAGAYVRSDPTYASKLWKAWENACAPMGLEPSPPANLLSLLFIGCIKANECVEMFTVPFLTPIIQQRESTVLNSYVVLEQPTLTSHPYMIMSTSTQRQTEGHEHPDRGSFSLYSHGTPLVLDPGVGWCGYNWFGTIPSSRENGTAFDKDLQFGAWYRGSQSHSMVNFGIEGSKIKPENETWRPNGAYGHEWGLRGAAWMEHHLFTKALDYVDVNITRAVQSSQIPTVQSYHRRIFANRREGNGGSYLIWDAIEASSKDCQNATYNLHVLTQLGWPGVVGCQVAVKDTATSSTTKLICTALNDMELNVNILQPSNAIKRKLLHIERDPLPVQFTGMTGSAGSAPGMKAIGGAFGGDWNAAGNLAPENPHWQARTPTWIRINAASNGNVGNDKDDNYTQCSGFLTLLQPRNTTEASIEVDYMNTSKTGSIILQTSTDDVGTLYLLGNQVGMNTLQGLAAVVGWTGSSMTQIDHVELIQGSLLKVPLSSLQIATSQNVTLSLKSPSKEQFIFRIHPPTSLPTIVTISLPWDTPPKQINVWRGAHVWHVANTTLDTGKSVIEFEALPGKDYLIERFCIRSMKAGYNDGKGGWLCAPNHPY